MSTLTPRRPKPYNTANECCTTGTCPECTQPAYIDMSADTAGDPR